MILTKESLPIFMDYSPETGSFTWKTSRGRAKAGDVAGCLDKQSGYMRLYFMGKMYLMHRLAWIHEHGDLDGGVQIDHINGNRADNRISNLREAKPIQNSRNRNKLSAHNTSGIPGVSFDKTNGKWKAFICISGKTVTIGLFDSIDDAAQARENAARNAYGEFFPETASIK